MSKQNILFLFFLLSNSILGITQDIKPAVQQGHFNDVKTISLSENEEILTSQGNDGQTIRWDLKTGMQLDRIMNGGEDLTFVKPKANGWITTNIDTSTIQLNDTIIQIAGPRLTISINGIVLAVRTTQYYDKGFSKIVSNGKTNYLFASSFDGLIYVYNKKDFKQVKLLKLHNSSVNDLLITKNGNAVFSASTDRSIIEWDARELILKRRFHGYSFRITSLAFDWKGSSIYLGNEIGELKKFSLTNYSQSLENYKASNHAITDIIPSIYENDSILRIVTLENRIQTFHPKKNKFSTYKKYHRISWKQSQQNVLENGIGMYLAPAFEKTIFDYNDDQTVMAYSGNEINGRLRRKIIFENKNTGKRKVIRSDWNKTKKLNVINDTLIAVLKTNDFNIEEMVSAQQDSELTIWKIKKKKLYSFGTKYINVSDVESYKNQFLFILKNDSLIIWNLKSNTEKKLKIKNLHLGTKIWIKNDLCFISDYGITILVFKIDEKNELNYQGNLFGHDGMVTCLDISPLKNLIATGSTDATIRFWSLDSLQHLGTLIPVSRQDFIIIAPTGEYQITKKAYQKFGFSSGTNFIYPAQFDLKFNMPHIVLKSIGIGNNDGIHLLENAYLKRLKRMGFENNKNWKEKTSLPEINIISKNKINSSQMELTISAVDKLYTLDRINVFVNDVPVYGSKGFSLSEKNIFKWEDKLIVNLINGTNKIEISLLNSNGIESLRKTILVEQTEENKSNLYIVAFGASEYLEKGHNLSYPDKDAKDLCALLITNPKNIFQNVYSKSVIDKNFTKETLKDCKIFLESAKTQDVVIVFVAGHGVLDKNLDYYLATYNMNFSIPSENGLPYEELESLLDGIAPLKKVLFLDACHSGEIDKEEVEQLATNTVVNSKVKYREAGTGIQKKNLGLKTTSELMGELFTDLRRGTGATVVSSAGGVESAMESDEWKNGLFTYCLLHGLKDKVADTNKDGEIWLSELQSYLRKEVTELSNGAQQPTSRIENLSMDFRVW